MPTENEHHHEHHGVIPVEEGIDLTTNWRAYLASSDSLFNMQSFWISIETIKSLLHDNPHADGIRCYLGLSNPSDPTSYTAVIVSTEHKEDVIHRSDGGSNVRDFVAKCPPVCPTGSPLNV